MKAGVWVVSVLDPKPTPAWIAFSIMHVLYWNWYTRSGDKTRVLEVVSRGHTPFHKRGKGSGNFFYSSLFSLVPRPSSKEGWRGVWVRDLQFVVPALYSAEPITAQYSVTWVLLSQLYKCETTVKPRAAALSVFAEININYQPLCLHNASKWNSCATSRERGVATWDYVRGWEQW